MKIFVFFGLIAFTATVLADTFEGLNDFSSEDVTRIIDFCRQANNISDNEFEGSAIALREHANNSESESASDESESDDDDDLIEVEMKFKCFGLCLLEEFELLGDDDKLDLDRILQIDDGGNREFYKNCKEAHDAEQNPCEYGFKVLTCIGTSLMGLGAGNDIENQEEI